MAISQDKPKSAAEKTAKAESTRLTFHWILSRKILYLGALLVALFAVVASVAGLAAAQEELPQINPGERKVPRKKDAGPRALALLKLTSDGKASLIPITILINGKFWDATAYKADPVPMALEPETVYEAVRTGNSLGLFTVASALHSKSPNVLSPWIGTGAWAPAGSEKDKDKDKDKTAHAADTVPVGIDTTDQPPRLTKNPQKQAPPASTAPAPTSTPSQSSGGGSSGDEPPRLTKPAESSPASTPSSSAPSSSGPASEPAGGSSPAGSNTPAPNSGAPAPTSAPSTESKPGEAASAASPKLPASDSGATEANRPRLRRGRPTESLPDEEVPGYSKPGALASANAEKDAKPVADQGQFQLIPAISDASGPEPRPFTFEWLKDEEGERRQQLTGLAKEQLRAYLDSQAKARITPAATAGQKARRTPAPKSPEPIFENMQMNTYDLWVSNQPVIVFSVEAHLPPTAGGQASPESQMQYSILLVAYPDIYNNLHKLYVGVTDKYHLDIAPRLQLVDAVDADGDGRGELLFRETSDTGSGWVIYRATADKLWKMFDSLTPE